MKSYELQVNLNTAEISAIDVSAGQLSGKGVASMLSGSNQTAAIFPLRVRRAVSYL